MLKTNLKLKVNLTKAQRKELESVVRKQSTPATKVRKARILLMADEAHASGRRRDWEIAEAVGISVRQVVRIRQAFVREGEIKLDRKPRLGEPKVLTGEAEAKLVTLCCSTPPKGHEKWTLQLLCDELARLKVVKSVCRETVRQRLKKTGLSLG